LILGWVVFLLTGCSQKSGSFQDAIARARGGGISASSKLGQALPYFAPVTLTPTWASPRSASVVTVPDFALVNQSGEAVDARIFENRTSVVGFIFTSCTGICPTLVRKLKKVEKELGSRSKVQFVLFTVDPEVDTPARLRGFARSQGIDGKRWTLVTGPKDAIYALVRHTFASQVKKIDDAKIRRFAHTEHFYLIDGERRLRGVLNGTRIDLPKRAMEMVQELNRA
jgi:protein SCO1/2